MISLAAKVFLFVFLISLLPITSVASTERICGQLIINETQITTDKQAQCPDIYGNRIVWQDTRDGDRNYDIYMYDLSTNQEVQITNNTKPEIFIERPHGSIEPAIYGNTIVWQDYRNGNFDIYMYNLSISKETQITTNDSNQMTPEIYGNNIVWCNCGNESIYMYNISTSTETRITASGYVYGPAIFGDIIVWDEYHNGNYDIYMYNLSTSIETQITDNKSLQEGSVDVYNDRIVWSDGYNIFMYNISTSNETQITTNTRIVLTPAIYGDKIVWIGGRNESDDFEIYMYDLSTSTETQVTTNMSFYPFSPAIYEDRIVWTDWHNESPDIYMATNIYMATINYLPVASFSANPTLGTSPLEVSFKDTSTRTPNVWNWNFGDGTSSAVQNPNHTYAEAGNYNVNLSISNANGTSPNPKTATITVQSQASSRGGSSSGGSGHQSSAGSNGGGAGGSPEPQSNVETKELSQTFISSGNSVKFDFSRKVTPVVSVSFDSKKTVGKTTTIVEMLKNESTLVTGLPSGEVYKYLNIWVGNGGFATSKNIENAVICFKVEKSWIQDKKVDKSSITLNRYSDEKWEQLQTSQLEEDDNYLYFTAKTPGFSPFSITCKTAVKENVTRIQPEPSTQDLEQSSTGANVEQTPEQKGNTSTPGFGIIYGIIGLLGVFLCKKRR